MNEADGTATGRAVVGAETGSERGLLAGANDAY